MLGKDEGLHGLRKLVLARCLGWIGLISENTENPKSECFAQALSIWSRWFEKVSQDAKSEDKDEMSRIVKVLGMFSYNLI